MRLNIFIDYYLKEEKNQKKDIKSLTRGSFFCLGGGGGGGSRA